MAGKKGSVHVTGKLNSWGVETGIVGRTVVIGKRKTVNILPVNSCVVTHFSFAGG